MSETTTTPSTLGRPDAIPESDLAEAEALFASFKDADERSTKWRRHNYTIWRTGWNGVARRYYEHCMFSHEDALELVKKLCACLHDWQNAGVYDSTNKYLGTYERGSRLVCAKCDETDVRITSRNNWSGD
jgi:hypothetical protein